MRRTLNANSSGPRVTPRSLLVHKPPTSTMVTVTLPCKHELPIKFSGDPHILNQHSSYSPPRTAVWCMSGAEHGVRSGGVEGYGPSGLELFLGGGRKKMRRSIWTKMTRLRGLTSQRLPRTQVPRSSTPGYFRPCRKPKHPTKTSGHPMTTTIGVFMPRPVVHPTCRTTQHLAGSVRLWDWIGFRSGGCDSWRAGVRCSLKFLGLA